MFTMYPFFQIMWWILGSSQQRKQCVCGLALVFFFPLASLLDPVHSGLLCSQLFFSLLLFHPFSFHLVFVLFLLSIEWLIFLFFVFLHSFQHFLYIILVLTSLKLFVYCIKLIFFCGFSRVYFYFFC